MNKQKHKIPWDIAFDNMSFFDSYEVVFHGEKGVMFKCDKTNYDEILAWGNTVKVGYVSPEYTPEIRHDAIFIADHIIKPQSGLYDLFQNCRKNS